MVKVEAGKIVTGITERAGMAHGLYTDKDGDFLYIKHELDLHITKDGMLFPSNPSHFKVYAPYTRCSEGYEVKLTIFN